TVETEDGETYMYDELLLATGGTPRTLPFEEPPGVHHLWEIERDGDPLHRDLERAERGIVIGGGLLGFDLVGCFVGADVDTTYLIREPHWWHSVLDGTGGAIVHDAMRDHGIDVRAGEEATGMARADGRVQVATGADTHESDVVGVAIGNDLNTALADESGLETGTGIVTDDHLRTDDPHIYAAGDVAEYRDPVLERTNIGGSWVTAEAQGKVAGRNMAGGDAAAEFVDTYTVTHFDLNVASLGDPVAEDDARVVVAADRDDRTYRKVVVEDGRIVGAALINRMQEMHDLKQLILQKMDVSGSIDRLEDPGFSAGDLR
ncbi:MAG: NAD(P)/FAD-dependent oxidoreductase, partial [Candidatus Nanohaloarchaea archaeon]